MEAISLYTPTITLHWRNSIIIISVLSILVHAAKNVTLGWAHLSIKSSFVVSSRYLAVTVGIKHDLTLPTEVIMGVHSVLLLQQTTLNMSYEE